jgi:hypothetical protein
MCQNALINLQSKEFWLAFEYLKEEVIRLAEKESRTPELEARAICQ